MSKWKRPKPKKNSNGFFFISNARDVRAPLARLDELRAMTAATDAAAPPLDTTAADAFIAENMDRFVTSKPVECQDDPDLARRSLGSFWDALPASQRANYTSVHRWRQWESSLNAPGAGPDDGFRFPAAASDEATGRVLFFIDTMDEWLLGTHGSTMQLLRNHSVGAMEAWLATGAREPGAAGEQVAQLLRAYVIGCSWLTEVARMLEATGLRDGVDRKFGARSMVGMGLVAGAGDAPTRIEFILAHRACTRALELCCYASSWHNGDQIALRWAEMTVRAAKAGSATRVEAEAIEFFLESIGCRVGSLMGRYFQKAIHAAGRAVAELGGTPLSMKDQHKFIGLTCVPNADPDDKAAVESKTFICPRPVLKPLMIESDEHGRMEQGTFWDKIAKAECSRHECEVRGKTKKCASCGFVSYCSVACQRADWKYHKQGCYPRGVSAEIPKWTKWK